MPKDLRTYLEQLRRYRPQDLKIVDKEVDPKWEITALIEKLRREQGGFPAVLFTNVKGSTIPALIN
ncbi:MAG TPA: UbiD family decarboxylase, partial [Candidatus Binatia bacterium]|nr:UbiD family decarboxylase [Candidatus Binatia bacterium]